VGLKGGFHTGAVLTGVSDHIHGERIAQASEVEVYFEMQSELHQKEMIGQQASSIITPMTATSSSALTPVCVLQGRVFSILEAGHLVLGCCEHWRDLAASGVVCKA